MLDVAFEIGSGATPTATASSWQSPEARVSSQSAAIHTTTGAPISWGNSVEQTLGNAPFDSPAGCFSDDEVQRRQDFSRATRPLHPCNTPPHPTPAPPHPTPAPAPPHRAPAPPPNHTPPPRPRPVPKKSISMTAIAAIVAIIILLALLIAYIIYSSKNTTSSSPRYNRSPFIQSSYF